MSLIISSAYLKLPYLTSVFPILSSKKVWFKVLSVLPKSSAVDSIDAFTYELLLNKRKQWELHRCLVKNVRNEALKSFCKVEQLSTKQIDSLILRMISDCRLENVSDIIAKCAESRVTPSFDVLIELYYIYSSKGDTKVVKLLQDLCCTLNYDVFSANGKFDHYMAKAQCYRGNLDKGMNMFVSVYETNQHLRWPVDNMLKDVISETVKNRSEASMVILRRNLEVFISKWNHYFPMTCFWQTCWLSEWFADQKLAEELFDRYEPLRNMVSDRIYGASSVLLRQGNEDAILRLLQTLLRHKLDKSYLTVLQLLFDYRLKQHNFRGCDEIIRNCRVLGLSLGPGYHEKYLYMVIDGKTGSTPPMKPLPSVKPFKLKF